MTGSIPSGSLSAEQVAAYQRDGYLYPISVMSATDAARLRTSIEAYERSIGAPMPPKIRQKAHMLFTWLDSLVRHPRILDAVESLLGPNLLCWNTNFFLKPARDDAFVSWHQDATYWGLSAAEVVTAWVAITPSTPANGCMQVAAGSHLEQLPHTDTFGQDNLLTRGQEIAVEVNAADAVAMPLAAGECSLHHVLIAHHSPPNRSDDRRIGFAIRYVPTHVYQVVGARDTAVLVRGVDTHGHFDLCDPPRADLAADAVARHAQATGMHEQVLYRGTGHGFA